MSRELGQQKWAAIVYGRTYHLDFRFITIPHDFTASNITWAAEHILATTHQARNLPSSPRWSMFKNDAYCVVGITCMVRDLIGKLGEDLLEVMVKDDQGRPLYVFVGYVTQLSHNKSLLNFPAYTGEHLASFKSLYQQVEKVWLIKDYHKNSKRPLLSQYQPLSSSIDTIANAAANINQISQFNHQTKYPDKTFIWSSSIRQNNQLWLLAARCLESTSICLNIKGKWLLNSPFLNQTVSQLEQFKVLDRLSNSGELQPDLAQHSSPENSLQEISQEKDSTLASSISQKISTRAKEDLDLTLQYAAKMATTGQELVNNFTDWSTPNSPPQSQSLNQESENFGFKSKKCSPASQSKQDWF